MLRLKDLGQVNPIWLLLANDKNRTHIKQRERDTWPSKVKIAMQMNVAYFQASVGNEHITKAFRLVVVNNVLVIELKVHLTPTSI